MMYAHRQAIMGRHKKVARFRTLALPIGPYTGYAHTDKDQLMECSFKIPYGREEYSRRGHKKSNPAILERLLKKMVCL